MPILARGERLEGALNVRTREPREFTDDEIELLLAIAAQVAQSIEHAKLYAEAQRRVHELEALARISEAVSESLYLEESLEAIVKTTMDALSATGAALVLEDGAIAWPEGRAGRARDPPAAALARPPDRRARRRPRDAVHPARPRAARLDRAAGGGRARARARRDARRARPGDPPPGQEQPADRGLAAAPAGARAEGPIDSRKALEDSVNRILAIAAVHEVLTEQRDDDVDLADLLDRLRAMLVQGVGAGREVDATLEPVLLAGHRATALALVFSELLAERARARRQRTSRSSSRSRNGEVVLAIADDGAGIAGEPRPGTGLSIVRALVRDELRGTLDLTSSAAARAPRCASRPSQRYDLVTPSCGVRRARRLDTATSLSG